MDLVRHPFPSSSPSFCIRNTGFGLDSLNPETLSYKLIPRLHLTHFPIVVSNKNSAEKKPHRAQLHNSTTELPPASWRIASVPKRQGLLIPESMTSPWITAWPRRC